MTTSRADKLRGVRQTALVQPGWYPDPFSPHLLRWWDGAQWTSFTAAMGGTTAGGGWAAADPAKDLAGVSAAGRRAAVAVVVGAVLSVGAQFFNVWLFGHLIHEIRHQIDEANAGHRTSLPAFPVWDLLFLPQLAVLIFVMIWLFRAATAGRRAGWPARREPVWAIIGFLIPIVNFWFPYQVARDAFPPGDPAGRAAGRWWGWYLGQSFAVIPVAITAFFSTPVAIGVAAIASIVPVMAAIEARALIAALDTSQRRALER